VYRLYFVISTYMIGPADVYAFRKENVDRANLLVDRFDNTNDSSSLIELSLTALEGRLQNDDVIQFSQSNNVSRKQTEDSISVISGLLWELAKGSPRILKELPSFLTNLGLSAAAVSLISEVRDLYIFDTFLHNLNII